VAFIFQNPLFADIMVLGTSVRVRRLKSFKNLASAFLVFPGLFYLLVFLDLQRIFVNFFHIFANFYFYLLL